MRLILISFCLMCPVFGEMVSLKIEGAPPDGLVIAPMNLTGAITPSSVPANTLTVWAGASAKDVAAVQFVPDPDFDIVKHAAGVLVLQLSQRQVMRLELEVSATASETQPTRSPIEGAGALFEFGETGAPAFPAKITFKKSGKVFDRFAWYDRLYDNEKQEQFWLREDKKADASIISSGDICTVIRASMRYCMADGRMPDTGPRALYDWYIFKSTPLVFVTGTVKQDKDFIWDELHFLELNYPDTSFPDYRGAEPSGTGQFSGTQKSVVFSNWGAVSDGANKIAVIGGKTTLHDGLGEFGNYINAAREVFRSKQQQLGAWLWIGDTADITVAVDEAINCIPTRAKVTVVYPDLEKKLETLLSKANTSSLQETRRAGWMRAMSESLAAHGDLSTAVAVAEGNMSENIVQAQSSELAVALKITENGLRLQSLFDLRQAMEFCAVSQQPPLFEIEFHHKTEDEKICITSDDGWGKVAYVPDEGFHLTFMEQEDKRLGDVTVQVWCQPRLEQSGFDWRIEISSPDPDWGLWLVRFPQLAIACFGEQVSALIPVGPGQMRAGACRTAYSYDGRYPSGWCSMPIMGVFDPTSETGLYCAVHDAWASTKNLMLESDPRSACVRITYEEPVPNMGEAPGTYQSAGTSVWQLIRGDWFDAGMVYKQWAGKHALWWPRLGSAGRDDTALWMRELCAWAISGGAPSECMGKVREFQQYLGVPCGFHWYNWHQIPFDNDYPHYFPTKEGFADAVAALQQQEIYVMPYINGRLWDMRDKDMEDFEFSSIALPATTKQPDGSPFMETYGSKESDGSDVRLGVMCPTTQLWQKIVNDLVLRLQNECGTRGVYIDQIAAASPVLCLDRTHGHPLGGGHWWNEGYWKLLENLRAAMRKDCMITTECNAEPFIRWLDGYLTWHWQYEGSVPLFPAIYGGTIQMFGRSYGGGPTRDLALRMRAAQQLVFGEQIGWIDPAMLAESESKDFFRQAVRIRYRQRSYFHAGEMIRPPRLKGDLPKVRADWQWGGEMWVTTDAVLTGAWQLPEEKKTIILLANVSEDPVVAQLDLEPYCIGMTKTTATVRNAEEELEKMEVQGEFIRTISVPARQILSWEIE